MHAVRREKYWLEGRADAIVDLVASGVLRLRPEDVAKQLSVPHIELRSAVKRHAQRKRRGDGPLMVSRKPNFSGEVPEGHKWCPRCNLVKPLEQFVKNRSAKSPLGVHSYCKDCWRNYNRQRNQVP